MSVAYAKVAPSAARSVAARASAIMCLPSIFSRFARDVEEPADQALPVAHGRELATQPGIKAETAAGPLERKQEHQHGQEHVRPRPLGRIAIEAEPELQHISDSQHAHESHREPEDHRTSEYQLGKKDNWSKHAHVRQHDLLQEGAVKLERRFRPFLFGPPFKPLTHPNPTFP